MLRWRPLRQAAAILVAAPVLVALRLGDPGPGTTEWPLAELPEPSGIVYHPIRKTLFVVGDEGDIGEVSLDGKLVHELHLGGDLEAISVDPKSGLLYVAREGHEVIFEVRPDDFRIVRRFTIDRSYKGDPNFLRRGGDGVEGLAFVPDDSDPEGAHLWVVNQYDPPVLVELAIPMRTSKEKFLTATIRRAIPIDSAPLSEVTWMPGSREFLVLSALWKRVSVLDADGNYERSVRIPGFMPEGITELPGGRFAIAQDSGGLVVWKPESDPFRGDAATGPPPPDKRDDVRGAASTLPVAAARKPPPKTAH
ncbi:MAG TPA: SdiA-regulated domain-containing protein [Candidatus Limnocylindrales bacterium]|nr:SdiA-regulated domain-containing protein [Candidatus Limnocylindrales bacterium]